MLNLFITNVFIPTITNPIRICYSSPNLIDNIFTKFKPNEDISSGILTIDMFDNLPVLWSWVSLPTSKEFQKS
ncbi:hypothetical protein LSH36_1367g00018 [Paralvinella palmiformis]|uniref:Uncharacterized protein n=1 Tax=Paralvinella palmiformis TaxID=53620 RepID=A0AAD9IT57_9ANNE|nr:hypothetical protein LSH36_1367g00018 [Paralvinella palmiformis]